MFCILNICLLKIICNTITCPGETQSEAYQNSGEYLHSLQQNAILIKGQGSQQVCIESSEKCTLAHVTNVSCTLRHQYIYIYVKEVEEKCEFSRTASNWQNEWRLRSGGSKTTNNWKNLFSFMWDGEVNWVDVFKFFKILLQDPPGWGRAGGERRTSLQD